jgi:hypothetical protein
MNLVGLKILRRELRESSEMISEKADPREKKRD